jgi:rSAM/selenodomain-associated transferase 2
MRLAVIMPVLDEAAIVAERLAALAPLRSSGHALIVVDGGSRDDTVALARPLADTVIASARGRARQMNAGAAAAVAAGSDVLLFLHADTTLPADAVSQIEAALAAPPHGPSRAWGRFDVAIDGRSRWLPIVAALMNARSRWSGIATGDQAIFVRADAFGAAGGFPDWPLMEDIGLSRSLKRISRPAALRARVVTAGRRWDANGALRTIALMWWLRLRFFLGAKPETLVASYTSVR